MWYIWTPSIGYLARLFSKHTFLHLIFQYVSPQVSVKKLPIRNQDSPYPAFWRFEFHVCCLWFRLDNQSLVCVHSVVLSFSWLCLTVFLIIFRGHTLLSLFICHLPERHMMSTHVYSSSPFVFTIVWVWHFYPLSFAFFIRLKMNTHTHIPNPN